MESQSFTFEQDPNKLWQAIGLLQDDLGNRFRVFVSASTKPAVDAVLQQIKTGKLKIGVTLSETTTRQEQAQPKEYKRSASRSPGTDVRVGISRLSPLAERKPPYRIRYHVDPPVGPDEALTFTFDNQDWADIRCTVNSGRVDVTLFEKDDLDRELKPRTRTATVTNPVEFHEGTRSGNKHWGVRVTGKAAMNEFALEYDKIVI